MQEEEKDKGSSYEWKEPVTESLEPQDFPPEDLHVCSAASKGTRKYQQDSLQYKFYREELLAAVCDGMGGMEDGAQASYLAITTLMELFQKTESPLEDVPGFFESAVDAMDRKVAAMEDGEGNPLRGGTTLAAVYITRKQLYWSSVGDSKVYLYRQGRLVSLTREHNYRLLLEEYLEDGSISPEEYEVQMRQGQALVSYLGMDGVRMADCSQKPLNLEGGDIILVCSDGLYKALSIEQIENILEMCEDDFLQSACVMVKAAVDFHQGPVDNCSVILIQQN